MEFTKFPIQPRCNLNGLPFNHIMLVATFPPGGGKGAFTEGEGILPVHLSMSKALTAAAEYNKLLDDEMKKARKTGSLVPANPYVLGITKHHIRVNRNHTFGDGILRHPDEIPTLRVLTAFGYRLVIIHGDLDDDTCVERMLKRGRENETEEVCRNRLRLYREHTLDMYKHIVERQLADVFEIGDISATNPDSRRKFARDILAGYNIK